MSSLATPPQNSSDVASSELYNFPPFFTLQPTLETREKQLQLWSKLICDWAKNSNSWVCVPSKLEIWENTTIQRRLGHEGQVAVVFKMISEGNAAWESPEDASLKLSDAISGGGRLRIMWQSANRVAGDIWSHVKDSGLMGQVFTVYELHSGDIAEGTSFHKMDP